MKKKIYSLTACFILLAALTCSPIVNVHASNQQNIDYTSSNQTVNVSSNFIDFCNEFFENYTEFKVLDKDGNNITELFYNENYSSYEKENFINIYQYALNNVDVFKKSTITEENSNQRASIQTKKYSDWFYKLEQSGKKTPDFEMQYFLSGSYNYNYNTGVITSATSPTFSLTYCTLKGVWSYKTINISTKSTIASNKYSMTASCSFDLETYLGVPIGAISIPKLQETLGTYKGSMTYYPE